MVVPLSHPQAIHVSLFPCLGCNLGHMLIHTIHAGITIKFLCKERRNKTRNHNTSKHCCYFWLLARTKLPLDQGRFQLLTKKEQVILVILLTWVAPT